MSSLYPYVYVEKRDEQLQTTLKRLFRPILGLVQCVLCIPKSDSYD